MSAAEYSATRSRKTRGRGKSQRSLDLIWAMYEIAKARQPITVRGIAYKLFTQGLIASMATKETQRVSRLLVDAREDGTIPWEWICDETRMMERVASWRDGDQYVEMVRRSYRRDFWVHQPYGVEVWSEKGTVRGVLGPVLEEFGVGFLPVHGFNSATKMREAAADYGQPLVVLYVGDFDPSGLYMSQRDLPERLERYGGDHITIRRIALEPEDLDHLPSFAAKPKDPRYKWFTNYYGVLSWELDAMDENELRDRVRQEIEALIEPEAWARCEMAQEAEQVALQTCLDAWVAP